MKRPDFLAVVGHDSGYLGNFNADGDLLLCVSNLRKRKEYKPKVDFQKFGACYFYTFNELDFELAKKKRIDIQKIESLSGRFFGPDLAKKIFDDLEFSIDSCSGLVISCNAGICRSPTIANALNDSYDWGFVEWFNEDKKTLRGFRKEYVYRVMIEEAKRRGLAKGRHS